MSSPWLRASGICFAYDAVDVLHDVDVTLSSGVMTAIVGPNGSGKSTLIEILAGTRSPRQGAVMHEGEIALVVQRAKIPEALPLPVREVVAMGTWARRTRRRRSRRAPAEAVDDALARVGLGDLARRSIHDVSGGQRQRALIAQGLARVADDGAGILLLDEPGAGLDADSRDGIRAILADEAARGKAIGWVTHDEEDIAWADQVVDLGSRTVSAVSAPPGSGAAGGARSR